jgi:hypothetical protein
LSCDLKKKRVDPGKQDFEYWNQIFKQNIKDSGNCRTVVVSMPFKERGGREEERERGKKEEILIFCRM